MLTDKEFRAEINKSRTARGYVRYRHKGQKTDSWVQRHDLQGCIEFDQMESLQRGFIRFIRFWRGWMHDTTRTLELRAEIEASRQATRPSDPPEDYCFDDAHYLARHDKCIEKHDNAVFTYEKFYGPLPDWV